MNGKKSPQEITRREFIGRSVSPEAISSSGPSMTISILCRPENSGGESRPDAWRKAHQFL